MLNILANMFRGRRSGISGLFGRRQGGIGAALNNNRKSSALGTIAMVAAPFVIRKLMARRQQRAVA